MFFDNISLLSLFWKQLNKLLLTHVSLSSPHKLEWTSQQVIEPKQLFFRLVRFRELPALGISACAKSSSASSLGALPGGEGLELHAKSSLGFPLNRLFLVLSRGFTGNSTRHNWQNVPSLPCVVSCVFTGQFPRWGRSPQGVHLCYMQQHRVVAGSAFPAGAVPGRQKGPQGGQFCTHGGCMGVCSSGVCAWRGERREARGSGRFRH